MKDLKKKVCMLLAFIMVAMGMSSVGAVTLLADEGYEIPKRMQANTIIEYVSDSEYVILQGGVPAAGLYNENGLTDEEQRIVDARYQRLREEMPDTEFIYLPDPIPVEGMIVYYDINGCISEIKNPFSLYHYYDDEYDPLPKGTTLEEGSYMYGIYGSTITITKTRVTGNGQITTFSDSIGEADNKLRKGDVATKGEVDNPEYGQQIAVIIPQKENGQGKTVSMYKRDNGKLYHAILDIWKDGVEYWGYTYTESLSFMDGVYTYTR